MCKPLLQVIRACLFLMLVVFANTAAYAETVNVAVASNFAYTLKRLSADFTEATGYQLRISSASTGKLFTQIEHGAPFDVFMSADEKRADLLVDEKKAQASSAYVYAQGQIVLLSNVASAGECFDVLRSSQLKRLSIANPRTAPYGFAAQQVLQGLSLWDELQPRLVKGENIAQTLQFVSTRNAQAGFVAKSMLNMGKQIDSACIWDIPAEMYSPINQKMVVLNKASKKAAVIAFLEFIKSDKAKVIIKQTGYNVL